ncbi:MAG TPA: ligase-associated DNA damage response endonuclease PdeM [Phycisphaerales bacterium]|nr:ligase-associated DNA damage response endonuclease PdeM [Phycisphaerales bacterium]
MKTSRWHGALQVEVAGEEVWLLPHRAAYWARARTLLIADVHLDKCEAMRVNGMPVPRVMDEVIARLEDAVRVTGAARVMVLGDLLHAPAGLTGAMIECFAAWRASSSVELALVPGNHDRGLRHVQDAWRMTVLPEVYEEGPFTFTHVPAPMAGRFVWGGHLHPAVTLRSSADSIKMACFHVGAGVGVLPAFSRFTAGGPLSRGRGDGVFAVAGDRVVPV